MQQTNVVESVFSKAHKRIYPKGQILFYQGEKTENVIRIVSGYVKVYDITSEGDEKLLLILGANDIFPLVWTFTKPERLHYFYEAVDDTEISVMKRDELRAAVESTHAFAIYLLEYFVNKSSDLMMRIECIEAGSAKFKVAQVLSYLASAHGDEVARCAYKVRIPTTHQMIANMSGLNRSTVSLQMKKLEKAKIFKDTASGGFIIHTDRIENLLEG